MLGKLEEDHQRSDPGEVDGVRQTDRLLPESRRHHPRRARTDPGDDAGSRRDRPAAEGLEPIATHRFRRAPVAFRQGQEAFFQLGQGTLLTNPAGSFGRQAPRTELILGRPAGKE